MYYRYLNAHGPGTASTVFLIVGQSHPPFYVINADYNDHVVAILDAGRNSMSFFLLLIVSLGLGVVRESLGRTMIKCQILAVCHFIFGGELWTSNDVPYLTWLDSHLCHWHCRTGTGVNIRAAPAPLYHPTGLYSERVPSLDHVCPQWCVVQIEHCLRLMLTPLQALSSNLKLASSTTNCACSSAYTTFFTSSCWRLLSSSSSLQ